MHAVLSGWSAVLIVLKVLVARDNLLASREDSVTWQHSSASAFAEFQRTVAPCSLGAGREGHKSLPLTIEVLHGSIRRMEGRGSHGDVIRGQVWRGIPATPA